MFKERSKLTVLQQLGYTSAWSKSFSLASTKFGERKLAGAMDRRKILSVYRSYYWFREQSNIRNCSELLHSSLGFMDRVRALAKNV